MSAGRDATTPATPVTAQIRRRRALLAALAGLAAGCAAPGAGGIRGARAGPSTPGRALVIGAGFAGLSAARALRQSGWQVTVLEARERSGGRVLTDRSVAGQTFDLGPSWLHAGPHNPLKSLAAGASIATRVTDYANVRFAVLRGAEREVYPRSEVLKFAQLFSGAIESAGLWAALDELAAGAQIGNARHLSVADVFHAAVQRIERDTGPADPSLVALQRWVLESNLAAPLEEVGFAALLDESDTDPENTLLPVDDRFVTGGMDQLTNLLALDLDIRLGDPVRRIEWRPGQVRVDTTRHSFEADAVVITIPVGLLASDAIEFAPALPPEKKAAAKRLPMGLLNKAFVLFPRPFWDTSVDFLTFHSSPPPLFYAWLNLYRYTGQPALLGFTAGAQAREVERMSDEAVRARIFSRLRSARRNGEVPEPLALRVSHWGSDPWARGSYSFLGIGASADDRSTLAAPLAGTLFFAGEATHRDSPSSVHGAWWSGLRAANEILGAA